MTYATTQFGTSVSPIYPVDLKPVLMQAFVDWPKSRADIPQTVAKMRWARDNEAKIGKTIAAVVAKEKRNKNLWTKGGADELRHVSQRARESILAVMVGAMTPKQIAEAGGGNRRSIDVNLRVMRAEGLIKHAGKTIFGANLWEKT